MKKLLCLLSALCLGCVLAVRATPTTPPMFTSDVYQLKRYFLVKKADGRLSVSPPKTLAPFLNPGEEVLASARYNKSNYDLGWDFLHVAPDVALFSNGSRKDDAYYYAGYLEGYLTYDAMRDTQQYATVLPSQGSCEYQFLSNQSAYLNANAFWSGHEDNIYEAAYWTQVRRLMTQALGLTRGYNAQAMGRVPNEPTVTELQVYASLLRASEFFDIQAYCNAKSASGMQGLVREQSDMSTGFVKVTKTDLFMGHATYSGYAAMAYRIYKVYEFDTTLSFSSYPGLIMSSDDFYMTGNFLGVQGVTLPIYNHQTTYAKHTTSQSIPTFLRLLVGLYTKDNALDWGSILQFNASGTGNKQYLVLDFKKFTPGRIIESGLLWDYEQVPGTVYGADRSSELDPLTEGSQGYFAQYGVPRQATLRTLCGYDTMEQQYGSMYSYTNTPKAQIFARDGKTASSFEAVQNLMRSNSFKTDSLSKIPNCTGATNNVCDPPNSAELAIAARGDLMPVEGNRYPGHWDTQAEAVYRPHYGNMWYDYAGGCKGSIDAKIMTYSNYLSMIPHVTSGPTATMYGPFDWSAPMCAFGQYKPTFLPANLKNGSTSYLFPWVSFNVNPPEDKPFQNPRMPPLHSKTMKSLPVHYLLRYSGLGTRLTVTEATFEAPSLFPGQTQVAAARYNKSNYDLGWDYLHVIGSQNLLTSSNSRDVGEAYYYGGYIEGYLTFESMNAINPYTVIMPPQGSCEANWINTQLAYVKNMTANPSTTFWRQVSYLMRQIDGLADGFMARSKAQEPQGQFITSDEVFVDNLKAFEFDDIAMHCQYMMKTDESYRARFGSKARAARKWLNDIRLRTHAMNKIQSEDRDELMAHLKQRQGEHCSALVKATPTDLLVGHTTWTGYAQMGYRIFKTYQFDTTVTMSSYPGYIMSGDDWYQTSRGLAIQETSFGIFNDQLLSKILPNSAPEYIRVMAANYFAADVNTWVMAFHTANSGTYNNQYMVVDFNKYTPGSTIVEGTLLIVEQVPGKVYSADQSAALNGEHGYWASYNIPSIPEVYSVTGYAQLAQQYGDLYSYTKSPRAQQFALNMTASNYANNWMSFTQMLRYNNYQYDATAHIMNCTGAPHNQCFPQHSSLLAIAARGDLMPLYGLRYPASWDSVASYTYQLHYGDMWRHWAGGCWGAIDAKIATWSGRQNLQAYVISGPSNEQQPSFTWTNKMCVSGRYVPNWLDNGFKNGARVYNFPWLQIVPTGEPNPMPSGPSPSSSGASGAIIAVLVVVVVLLIAGFGAFIYKFRHRLTRKERYAEVSEQGLQ